MELQEEKTVRIKTENVCAKGRHPEDILSNLCGNDFCYDGVQCGCMESFLQSLKYNDVNVQTRICLEKADYVKKYDAPDWQQDQILWWKGQPLDRHSTQYTEFIYSAYESMYLWCGRFRDALMKTVGKQLLFDSGKFNPKETVLTDSEFCSVLTKLRDNKEGEYGRVLYSRRWPNSYGVEEDYE